jgi:hypothetical protein
VWYRLDETPKLTSGLQLKYFSNETFLSDYDLLITCRGSLARRVSHHIWDFVAASRCQLRADRAGAGAAPVPLLDLYRCLMKRVFLTLARESGPDPLRYKGFCACQIWQRKMHVTVSLAYINIYSKCSRFYCSQIFNVTVQTFVFALVRYGFTFRPQFAR